MRVFLAPASAPISPLDAPARDALVLDRTLGETMLARFKTAGLDPTPVQSLDEAEARAREEKDGAFVILDSVLASLAVLRRFVASARSGTQPTSLCCALPRSLGTDLLSHLDGLTRGGTSAQPVWTAPFYFLRGASASIGSASAHVLPYKEQVLKFPLPPGVIGRSEQQVGVSASYLCNVSHWVHVLRVNTSAIAGWWLERLHFGVILGPLWVAWRILCGFPWRGGRLGGALNGVKRGAKVHHTALLELSIVGKGATIGAHASVRNSFIAEGAQIGDGARIFGSVIGKGAFVGTNCVVFNCVVYPEAFAAQLLMQVSILARRAVAFANSAFFDLNFSKNIRVPHRGGFADTGDQFLGACIGAGARIGAGVWLASGREVPSGALLIKPAGEVVQKIGALERDVPYVVRDGVLVRAGQT